CIEYTRHFSKTGFNAPKTSSSKCRFLNCHVTVTPLLALRVCSFVLALKAGSGTPLPAHLNRLPFIEMLPCNTG
ncbi:MAG TPA: hypothetical protein VJU82_08280, partial [Acidobacteriaceae bacterium]|nr:hypothetical protein [Acidobacteriaceae bacterium]